MGRGNQELCFGHISIRYLIGSLIPHISWLGQGMEIWKLADYKRSSRSKCRWRREDNREPTPWVGARMGKRVKVLRRGDQ